MNQQDRELIQELIDGFDKHLEARTAIAERNQRRSVAFAKARQLGVAETQKKEATKPVPDHHRWDCCRHRGRLGRSDHPGNVE